MSPQPIKLFGEVLFDCFPDGSRVLGGAPFNVAWHLQAMGLSPLFISKVGDDPQAREIRAAMQQWGMNASALQMDSAHATGEVAINFVEGEPSYQIVKPRAYDFIDSAFFPPMPASGLLYHGSLALRNEVSLAAFEALCSQHRGGVFFDVNLRDPWWSRDSLHEWLVMADWVKLNQHELQQLGLMKQDLMRSASAMIQQFALQGVIITSGEQGAMLLTATGEQHQVTPQPVSGVVDTVGAGDAFTSVIVAGLAAGWPLADTMQRAQQLASLIVTIRGALPTDRTPYQTIFG